MRRLITGLACAAALGLHAQTTEQPATLAALRDRARPLLLFAPGAEDGRFRAQIGALDGPGMRDRQIPLVLILAAPNEYGASGNIPSSALAKAEQAAARARFGVGEGQFRVVLLGKDGGEKFSSATPVSWGRLASLVDSMPMRREEMQGAQAPTERLQRERAAAALQRERAQEALLLERKREQAQTDARTAALREERTREQARADARERDRRREQARQEARTKH